MAGGGSERPSNWKQAELVGWPSPVYNTEEERISVQHGFMRKVYGILCLQLLATVTMCWVVMYTTAVNRFVLSNPWLTIVSFVTTIALIFALQVYKNKYPTNMQLLMAFTFAESFAVAAVCAHYEAHGVGQLVGMAWGITLIIFAGLTVFVHVSRWDFSFMGLFLPAALVGFLLYSVVCLFVGIHAGYTFAFLGALLFSAFIIYDTHQIMTKLGCDDYITACIEVPELFSRPTR